MSGVALPTVLIRIERRRAAAWLGLSAGAGAAWWLGREVSAGGLAATWPAVAIGAGAVAAGAALGGLPSGAAPLARAWAGVRAGWPAVGIAAVTVGGLVTGLPAGPGFAVAAAMLAAVAGTAAVVLAATRRGSGAADAMTAAGAIAAAAVTAALIAARVGPASAGASLAAAAACWIALAVAWLRGPRPAAAAWGASGPLIASAPYGPLGRGAARAAMPVALGGMTMWLFLAPESAWWYAAVAAAWIACVAVPAATLGPGCAGQAARRRLCTTAPCGARRARSLAWRSTWSAVPATVAVFVWPTLVAAVLAGATPSAAERLVMAAAITAWGVALAGIAAVVLAFGGSREAAHAAALVAALVAACCGLEGRRGAGNRPVPGAGTDVEHSAQSCKTPTVPPVDSRRSPFPRGAVSCQEDSPFVRVPRELPASWRGLRPC